MSYLVLARKYRPQTFEDVVAQKHITATLQNAIKQERFSHAYLFTGTRGTGKTTTARILAKALNCEKGPIPVPCNECVHCRQITDGSSLDVIEIDAASNTGVDDIRNLKESVHYSPASAKYKIYIIDEVHRLSGNAFDALLKTLEEPPAHVIFIFATTDPQKLPATILSRCQRYDFRRIPFRDLTEYLQYLADQEKINIDEDALALVAQKGEGSLRDSLSIFEQVIACAEDKITREVISDLLGLVDLELLFNLTDCIIENDSSRALDLIQEMFTSGVDVSQFIADFQEHFRKILIINSSQKASEYLSVSDYFLEKYTNLKDKFSDSDIFRYIKVLSDLQSDLKAGADPAIFLEIAILRLVKMESSVLLEDILKKISKIDDSRGGSTTPDLFNAKPSSGASSASTPNPVPQTPSKPDNSALMSSGDTPVSDSGETATAVKKFVTPLSWSEFVGQVKAERTMLGQFLEQGELTRMDDQSVELTYLANGNAYQQYVSKRENQKIIEKHMQTVFGRALRLVTKIDKSRMPEERPNGNSRFDVTPDDYFKKNPDLKKITDDLGGEIKAIKLIGNKGENNV